MTSLKPFETSAHEIAKLVGENKLSKEEVLQFYFKRSETYQNKLNSFLWHDAKKVAEDKTPAKGRLAGVPIVVKDNISTAGIRTSCGSKILENYIPVFDATVVKRLKAEGAVIFAKSNLDEFAMGSSNENSAYGSVKNPWDLTRVPGGSSGGSAASVAQDLAPVALGSDTGGSIRQPASHCGIVGLKPTYGRVSRFGLVSYGSSLDQIGPMTKNVLDAALLLDVLSGHDEHDATSEKIPSTNYFSSLSAFDPKSSKPLSGLKIGLVKEFFQAGLSKSVRKNLNDAVEVFKSLGAAISEIEIPKLKYSIATYYIIATAEASANLARFDGIRYGYADKDSATLSDLYKDSRSRFGKEVKQRIMLGTFSLSSGYYDAYYNKACQVRKMLTQDFAKAFTKVDLLLSPTASASACKIGEKSSDPMAIYLADICTLAANLTQVPAMSIPCGYDVEGLPIGLQLMAPKFGEERMLKGAYCYESATEWRGKRQPKC